MLYFDLETSNRWYGSALHPDNFLVCVAWAVDDEPVQVAKCVGGYLPAAFVQAYIDNPVRCAHNAKFEQLWMRRMLPSIGMGAWHDPMLAERVMLGNLPLGVSLDAIAKRRGLPTKDPLIDSLMKAGVCPSQMPYERLSKRCVKDVEVMRAIFAQQREELDAAGKHHLYRVRADFCTFLSGLEHEGMLLDRERVERAYESHVQAERELRMQLDEKTGGINLNSGDQLAEYLYTKLKFAEPKDRNGKPKRNKPSKRWPGGRPKTDKDTLAALAATTDEQREFLDLYGHYKSIKSALSKSLEFFVSVVTKYDCKFHAQFNQTVAATHRLTSTGIPLEMLDGSTKSTQLQNMGGAFKRLFCAPPGYKIVEVDAAQLEFRVAAYVGNDQQAKADIADPDFDAHCTSASVMNAIDYRHFLQMYRQGEASFAKMRKAAKPDTFKPLYGGTKGTPAQERWYAEFRRRYAGVAHAQETWQATVAADHELTLPWGMTFYWPHAHFNRRGVLIDDRTGRPLGPQICNYPVQELATAEIVPIAILALAKRCEARGLDVTFVNTIHDSVIAYVRDDQLDAYREEASLAFTVDVYEYLRYHYNIEFDVPLGMGFVAGDFWGEGEEYVYDDVQNRNRS